MMQYLLCTDTLKMLNGYTLVYRIDTTEITEMGSSSYSPPHTHTLLEMLKHCGASLRTIVGASHQNLYVRCE